MKSPAGLNLREIKSTSTYSAKMGKGLRAFAELSPRVADSIVVYLGREIAGIAANFAMPEEHAP